MSELREEDVTAVLDALRSGWLTMGPRIAEFEAAFAEWAGARHAIAVASGSAALHLAVGALAGPGDEVVVPSISGTTAAAAAEHRGAVPFGVEVRSPTTPVLAADGVSAALGPRTAAVVVTHAFGVQADVEAIAGLGRPVIEDRRGALGVPFSGVTACCSFADGRVLPMGEGGMVVTDDDEVDRQVRLRRAHAMTSGTWDRHRGHSDTYDVVDVGFNFRLDEPRAALGLSRLRHLDDDLDAARERAIGWVEALAAVPGVELVVGPEGAPDSVGLLAADRVRAAAALTRIGVATRVTGPLLALSAGEDPSVVAVALTPEAR
jgi:dTDP-4-amino-4,6-dideoxygalactose transaminase